jgi:hypothetical protein
MVQRALPQSICRHRIRRLGTQQLLVPCQFFECSPAVREMPIDVQEGAVNLDDFYAV